jgi:hypothetical protein
MKIIITESQLSLIVNEDYASDLKKNIQAGNKQATINKTTCPPGYKMMTKQEMDSYSSQTVKPWRDTTRGDKAFITLPNGSVCKSFRSDKLGGVNLEDLMNSMRDFMGGKTGILIQTVIDLIGGKLVNMAAWGLLLAYDVLEYSAKNKMNWYHFFIDLAGVLLSGGASYVRKALGPIASRATGKLSDFVKLMATKTPKLYSWFSNLSTTMGSVASKVATSISNFVKAIGKYAKGTAIYKGLLKMQSMVTSALNRMVALLRTLFGKKGAEAVQQAAKAGVHTGTHYQQHQTQHDAIHAGVAKLTGAHH